MWRVAQPRKARASRITFELSGRQRQATRPGMVKMYRVPPARAWWLALVLRLSEGLDLTSDDVWREINCFLALLHSERVF